MDVPDWSACGIIWRMREDFFGAFRAPLRIVVVVLMAGAITLAWMDYRGQVADRELLHRCGTTAQAEVLSIVERSRTDAPLVVSVSLPDGSKADVDVEPGIDDVRTGRLPVVWCPGRDEPLLTQHAFSEGPDLASAWQVTVLFSVLGAVGWFWVFRPPGRSRSQRAPS